MYDLPMPVADPDGAEYYAGLRRHELLLKHCADCDRFHFYPRELCPHCHGDRLSWRAVSGRGQVYTYTVARRAAGAAFKPLTPYVVAIVELEEGPRMMVNMPGVPHEAVRIGLPVHVRYDDVTDDMTLPRFEPA